MSDKKLLTILIPAYNGAKYLSGLLHSFANYSDSANADERFLRDCEILVVNNRSTDNTLEMATAIGKQIPNFRIETPDSHVPTAEQNVFRSFKHCRGEFTWVLGCDDIVRFEAIPQVLEVAEQGKYDLAIFNFMQSDKDGGIETYCNYFMRDAVYEGDLVSFTQRMGFWWLIAGFSGQIVRTSRVVDYDHSRLVAATSPIYSHVTAYLECLAQGRAAILNVQNVVYRLSDNDADHWRRAAALMNVFDEYFWTLGYIRQISYLEERDIVGADYLTKMIESNREGFFRPTAVIYGKLLSQLRLMKGLRSRREDRNKMSESEFEEIVSYLERRDLLARPFLISIREIYEQLTAGRNPETALFEEAHERLQSYGSTFILSPHFVGIDADYEIYEISGIFYGVHRFFREALLDVVRHLDPLEQVPIVFSGRSRVEVTDRIRQQGIALAWDEVSPSLMRYCTHPFIRRTSLLEHSSQYGTDRSDNRHDQMTSLGTAQRDLKYLYRSKRSAVTRVAAWTAALSIKATKRMLSKERAAEREAVRA